jgi:uncharacterized membrane protein YtjA (UPF0391 family)
LTARRRPRRDDKGGKPLAGLATTTQGQDLFGENQGMLRYALLFLVVAIIAGVLGLSGVAWLSKEIAWILVVVFLILFVVSLVMGRRGPPA